MTQCSYDGQCPLCACGAQTTEIVSVGRAHFGVCREHLTKWYIGDNLFSSWHDQTEDECAEAVELLALYADVDAVHCHVCWPDSAATPDCEIEF